MMNIGRKRREEAAELAQLRSNAYGLLSRIYRKEVSLVFVPFLKDPQFLGVLSIFGAEIGEEFLSKPDEEIVEELAVEYARLFLGPDSHISPHESVHCERDDGQRGLLWGTSTVEVKKFIESAGLTYKDDFTDMPDHIGVELEFMQMAVDRERQAWEEGDRDGALYSLKMQKMFIEEHLIKWVPQFCCDVIVRAELPFYREIAKITKSFIEFEKENIGSYVSDAQP